jgi:hypothetical protein
VAARVSAARALAQQLSQEKQVALTEARLAAERAADQKELARWGSKACTYKSGLPDWKR